MSYDYTPFDPQVWLIFAVFVICTFLVVKLYHRKHPEYPKGSEEVDE
jgi:hypothetical protein